MQNIRFLNPTFSDDHMSYFWFAYYIIHDITIRAQRIDFKFFLITIPTFVFPDACRNTFFLGKYHVLSNLLRWHPTVFSVTIYYVRRRTSQFDYLVDKNKSRICALNDTILILVGNQFKTCGVKY